MFRSAAVLSALSFAVISASGISTSLQEPGGEPTTKKESSRPERYEIDPVHSTAIFRVGHLGISKFYGRFNLVKGTILFDEKNPGRSRAEILVDAASLDTHDPKRDRHIKGPDFLDAKQFPVLRFVSTEVVLARPDSLRIRGKLEIHGVEREIRLDAVRTGRGEDPWGGYRCGFEARFRIKRSDFGMKFMLGPVGDEVDIILSVEGIRK